jgi:transcription elongation factor Elf1
VKRRNIWGKCPECGYEEVHKVNPKHIVIYKHSGKIVNVQCSVCREYYGVSGEIKKKHKKINWRS